MSVCRMQGVETRLELLAHRAGNLALRFSRLPSFEEHRIPLLQLLLRAEQQTEDVEHVMFALEDYLSIIERREGLPMVPAAKPPVIGGESCADI